MKKLLLAIIIQMIITVGVQTATAQITINVPKLPKINKTKPEPTGVPVPQPDGQVRQTQSDERSQQPDGPPTDFRLKLYYDEINAAIKSVDEYSVETKLYMVNAVQTDWLMRAISPKTRSFWITNHVTDRKEITRFDGLLDALRDAAAKKLPAYRGDIDTYKIKGPGEEKLLKTVFSRIERYTIFSVGVAQTTWKIDANELGIPRARYKNGALWLRNTNTDHPYCYLSYVNIIQSYAGGGTYGDSQAEFIRDEVVGCPTRP